MSRRTSSVDEVFQTTVEKLNALVGTPLLEINKKLSLDLEQAKASFLSKSLSEEGLTNLCAYIRSFVDRLPQSFERRFFFDAAFILALARDFADGLPCSGMMVPRYGENWGHERLMMPWEKNAQRGHAVHLIHICGGDRLKDVDLLEYPWIAHEWGHYLMLRHDSSFSPDFTSELDEIIKLFRLSAFADRGLAKQKSQRHIQELIRFWTPSADHRNWAHELAIDLLSLWTCGPAYLACFEDYLRKKRPNPYMIEQSHPPYAVRTEALIEGARQLGLGAYTSGLTSTVGDWDKSNWRIEKDNHFIGLNNREIIKACIHAAFGFCRSLNLAKCSVDRVEAIRSNATKFEIPGLGVDLLLMARSVFNEKGEEAYNRWEHATVDTLAVEVTL
ncbi:MAG: hypothetical protein WAO35_25310 [Terriglobia bacterium]